MMHAPHRWLLFMLAAIVPAFGSGAAAETASPITIALSSNSLAYGGLRIAQQLKLFDREGLAPRIVIMDSGSAATAALVGGSAEFSGAGPAEVIAARARGMPLVIATNVYHGAAAPLVLSSAVAKTLAATPASPLQDRYKALNGLTIAVPSATSALLAPIRNSAELEGAKAKFVYMAQPAMGAALQAGAIQGFVATAPFWTASVQSGDGVVWVDAPKGEVAAAAQPSSTAVLVTTTAYAEAHPDIIRRLRAVFTDVGAAIKQDPAAAFEALKAAYPQVDPSTLQLAFDHDAANWSQPVLTDADMQQEIRLLRQTVNLTNLDAVNPADLLAK